MGLALSRIEAPLGRGAWRDDVEALARAARPRAARHRGPRGERGVPPPGAHRRREFFGGPRGARAPLRVAPGPRSHGRWRVVLDWRAGRPRVRGEAGRLGQALDNLVANAVEHGAGRVTVVGRLTRTRSPSRCLTSGTGCARSLSDLRPASWRSRRGHGLAIVRRAVEDHGGRMQLVRESSGTGVQIRLPLAPESPTAEPARRRASRRRARRVSRARHDTSPPRSADARTRGRVRRPRRVARQPVRERRRRAGGTAPAGRGRARATFRAAPSITARGCAHGPGAAPCAAALRAPAVAARAAGGARIPHARRRSRRATTWARRSSARRGAARVDAPLEQAGASSRWRSPAPGRSPPRCVRARWSTCSSRRTATAARPAPISRCSASQLVDFRDSSGRGRCADDGADATATVRATLRQAVTLIAAQNFAREVRVVPRPAGDARRLGPASVTAAALGR